ncbi:MAG: hypothetical protein KDC05_08140 [Bacteroidales bacterium]|nr:hypothetical protein [Bacteroidales bacterium]
MKTIAKMLFVAAIFAVAYSCSNETKKQNEALKAEVDALARENAELANGNMDMEHSIQNYQAVLKDIDAQLASIDEKQNLIKSKSNEFKDDAAVQEEIQIHMQHLHHQMENSKHKIAHLNNNMNKLRKENAHQAEELHKMDRYINDLANLIVRKDSEIVMLQDAVMVQGIALGGLAEAYANQAVYNEVLLDIINTGFYVAGTKKELKDMGIIEMEGGFIGIGRVKTLNANAPVEFLTPVDIRNTDRLEFAGKNAELITPHATESFEFAFDDDTETVSLGISNKLKFWQETNYLVVQLSE